MPHDDQGGPLSPSMRKRTRGEFEQPPTTDDAFINDADAVEGSGDDDDDDGEPKKNDKKAGRRKIKIEYIQDKSRRHITFSKRKAGIMKKAYELSTLTGTQVLLLVVSETGLVYTFTTAKLQPLVTQPEGKNLIQACLNAPIGAPPSSHPVGQPITRSSPQTAGPTSRNVPGGLSIGGPKDDVEPDDGDDHNDSTTPASATEKSHNSRRRSDAPSSAKPGVTSPSSPNLPHPPPPPTAQIAMPASNAYPYQQGSPTNSEYPQMMPTHAPYGSPYQPHPQQHAQRTLHGHPGQPPQPQHWPVQQQGQQYGR